MIIINKTHMYKAFYTKNVGCLKQPLCAQTKNVDNPSN